LFPGRARAWQIGLRFVLAGTDGCSLGRLTQLLTARLREASEEVEEMVGGSGP